jgi:hypothetical protein
MIIILPQIVGKNMIIFVLVQIEGYSLVLFTGMRFVAESLIPNFFILEEEI